MRFQKSLDGKTIQRGASFALHALFSAAIRNAKEAIEAPPHPLPVAYPCRGSIEAILSAAAAVEAAAHEAAEPCISQDRFLDFCKVKREFKRLVGDKEPHSVGKWILVMTFYNDADDALLGLLREVWEARTALTHHKARENSTVVKYGRDVVNEALREDGVFWLQSLDTEPQEISWGAVERFGTPSFSWVVYEMVRRLLLWMEKHVGELGCIPRMERPYEPYFPRTRAEHQFLWDYWKKTPSGSDAQGFRDQFDDLLTALPPDILTDLGQIPGVLEELHSDGVPSPRSLGHLLVATGAKL